MPHPALLSRRAAIRTALWGAAGTLALLHSELPAADLPPSPPPSPADGSAKFPNFELEPVRTEEIAPGFCVLSGPGGNVGVRFPERKGDAGDTLLIDAGIRVRAAEVQRVVSAMSPAPIRRVVNTHWHYDHVGGNETFARGGAIVFAHANVLRRVSEDTFVELMGRTVPALPPSGRPTVTFAERVGFPVQDAHVIPLAPAHTDGDCLVHLPSLNLIQTGDVFWNGGYPLIDYSTSGSLEGMIAALERVLALTDEKTRVVPGHGPVGNRADVEAFRAMLVTAGERIRPLFLAGKSLEETIAARPTAELDERWGGRLRSADFFVRAVYGSMKARQGGATR